MTAPDEVPPTRQELQLALFLNGRDTAETGTARWEKLPIDAQVSYLKDARAILGAVRLLDSVGEGDAGPTATATSPTVPADEREASAALDLIREMHRPRQASWASDPKYQVCTCNEMYPCRTVKILEAAKDAS